MVENDEATSKRKYGAVYNWYVVDKGGLCPVGWHVPTLAEWNTLILTVDSLAEINIWSGGVTTVSSVIASNMLRATGTIETGNGFWHYPNTEAINEFCFTAIPNSNRLISNWNGGPVWVAYSAWCCDLYATWWAQDESPYIGGQTGQLCPYMARLAVAGISTTIDDNIYGFNVRCIKNLGY
jgi:uncharacterized protein (TIGR02145 family)